MTRRLTILTQNAPARDGPHQLAFRRLRVALVDHDEQAHTVARSAFANEASNWNLEIRTPMGGLFT